MITKPSPKIEPFNEVFRGQDEYKRSLFFQTFSLPKKLTCVGNLLLLLICQPFSIIVFKQGLVFKYSLRIITSTF